MQSRCQRPFRGLSSTTRRLSLERLEDRKLLAGLPLGAVPSDTAEFLLGRVAVTPVLIESDGTIDPSTQNWADEAERAAALAKVQLSTDWWSETLDSLGTVHELEFVIDTTYIDTPYQSPYEPIDRPSSDYTLWGARFLEDIEYEGKRVGGVGFEQGIRDFNHSQRLKFNTDWSFTIFIVDSSNDLDGQFASGGPFKTAFALPGGLFYVTPSTRPATTFTHETGHIFYAFDEYSGGASYNASRGYYNAQNLNALRDNPDPNFVQEPSIMSGATNLQTAFINHTSPASTLAHVGWQDTDGDGIFDLLDVPMHLEGSGHFDAQTQTYRFVGSATAVALPNQNSAGLQNDITFNEISRIEYRLDDGRWTVATEPATQQVDLDLSIPIGPVFSTIDLRAIDLVTGITSNIVSGTASIPHSDAEGGLLGYAWLDTNENSVLDADEQGLQGARAELIDGGDNPLDLVATIEPDEFPDGILSDLDGVSLSWVGDHGTGDVGVDDSDFASTGERTFFAFDSAAFQWSQSWSSTLDRKLKAEFDQPVSDVSIDAIGLVQDSYARIEAYDASGGLIKRITSDSIGLGQTRSLEISTSEAEIAAVIVFGHAGTSVALDNLNFGTITSTISDAFGVFSIDSLADGDYRLRIEPPNSTMYEIANPIVEFSVRGGAVASPVPIPIIPKISPWQNIVSPYDVDGKGSVEPLDALIVINELNRNGSRTLTASDLAPPYYDVNASGTITPVDALIVINELSRQNAGGSGESPAIDFRGGATVRETEEATDLLFASTQSEVTPLKRLPVSGEPASRRPGKPLSSPHRTESTETEQRKNSLEPADALLEYRL